MTDDLYRHAIRDDNTIRDLRAEKAELVARLEAAEAEPRMFTLAEMQEVREAGRAAEAQVAALTHIAEDWKRQYNDAEAQVAALTHRLEDTENARAAWQTSCEAAEAALADTRRALDALLLVIVDRWHEWKEDGRTLAEFMELTDEQYAMFVEQGNEGYVRALAAAGGGTGHDWELLASTSVPAGEEAAVTAPTTEGIGSPISESSAPAGQEQQP